MTEHESIAARTCKRKRETAITKNRTPTQHNNIPNYQPRRTLTATHIKHKKKRKRIKIDTDDEEENQETEQNDDTNNKNKQDTQDKDDAPAKIQDQKKKTNKTNKTQTTNRQTQLKAYFKNKTFPDTNYKSRPLTTTIPTPTITTYNITSLSAYATPYTESYTRQRRVIEEIIHLAKKADIILLQETKLDAQGTHIPLQTALPNWKFHYNNNPDNTETHDTHTAGTLIATGPMINKHYNIKHEKIHRNARGHTQSILLEGKDIPGHPTPLPLRIINVYLPTGENLHARRAEQIGYLLELPNNCHTVMAGDYNFVENEDDTTNYSKYHHLSEKTKDNWDSLMTKHGFWEVSQPIHTQHALNIEDGRTSRLDRFYINHTEADTSLYTPKTNITNTPHSTIHTITKDQKPNHKRISTHCAVTLDFQDTNNPHRNYKLPPWITQTKAFKKIFCDLWYADTPSPNAFEEEQRFKRTAQHTHAIGRDIRPASPQDTPQHKPP